MGTKSYSKVPDTVKLSHGDLQELAERYCDHDKVIIGEIELDSSDAEHWHLNECDEDPCVLMHPWSPRHVVTLQHSWFFDELTRETLEDFITNWCYPDREDLHDEL